MKIVLMNKRIFVQVMERGPWFSFVFFMFFMMSFLPIIMLFFASLYQKNLLGIVLALVLGAVLARNMKRRKLYEFCRDMALLNLTLWFLLGFFSLIEGIVATLPGILAYILLIPYALISGYLNFYLLSRANKKREKVLYAGIAVSTMIAIISAISGAIMHVLRVASEQSKQIISSNGNTPMITKIIPEFQNPHLSFILVLILFNIPFIVYYFKKGKTKPYRLLWYLIPICAYILLVVLWNLFKGLFFP